MAKVVKFFKRLIVLAILVVLGSFLYINFFQKKSIAIVYHGDDSLSNGYANVLFDKNVEISMFDLSNTDAGFYVDILDGIDGLIFAGGRDFDSAVYGGGDRKLLEEYNFEDDKEDLKILDAALDKDLKVLGICRGCQLINIYFGGSLYEDLKSQFSKEISHRDGKDKFSRHMINIEKNSRLASLSQEDIYEVNSYHHQGIKALGQGLRVMAKSDDGLIEAIENPSYSYLVGVQWHPEADSQDYLSKKIFDDFIDSL